MEMGRCGRSCARRRGACGVAMLLIFGSGTGEGAAAGPTVAEVDENQLDEAIDQVFPRLAEGRRVDEFEKLVPFVTRDVLSVARTLDKDSDDELNAAEQDESKPLRPDMIRRRILHDTRIARLVSRAAEKLSAVRFYMPAASGQTPVLRRGVLYLSVECVSPSVDPLSSGLISGSFSDPDGVELTAGLWKRFKIVRGDDGDDFCGFRLGDLPATILARVADEYPSALAFRWSWKGLPKSRQAKFIVSDFRSMGTARRRVWIPDGLAIEIVTTADGSVIWTGR